MSARDRLARWLVTDDPNPQPSQLDRIGGTYGIIHAAVTRGSATSGGTTLLKPADVDRVTLEVLRALDLRDAGENGDVAAMRNAVAR